MIQTTELLPGITLRVFPDDRFKQNCLSLQFVRPMQAEEAALNALLPAVLLRGCESAPDLRSITLHLDDLYGASVGALVRRVGDYQTTGMSGGFISDRFTLGADRVLAPMLDFLRQLLLEPVTQNGIFRADYVQSEKKNLIATIQAQKNDKRAYCSAQMLKKMCACDSYGLSRLGEVETVRPITPQTLFAHYQKVLRESPVEICYVGQDPENRLPELLSAIFRDIPRDPAPLPVQTHFRSAGGGEHTEVMEVAQGKLCMGFSTPIDLRNGDLAAMQVCNMLFGGGMTSKLFMIVREKLSLCYDIGSYFHGSKGIVTVSAGIDCDKYDTVRSQVQTQLEALCSGQIAEEEMFAAKQALISGLRGTHDSPGAIESYYATAALSGLALSPEEYILAIEKVDVPAVAAAAQSLKLDTVYFLKGAQ